MKNISFYIIATFFLANTQILLSNINSEKEKLYKKFVEETVDAIYKGADPTVIQKNIELYSTISEMYPQLLSWKLGHFNNKKIMLKCLDNHPNKLEVCTSLADYLEIICTGKNEQKQQTTPEEKKLGLLFRKEIQKNVENMLDMKDDEEAPSFDPEFIYEFLQQEFGLQKLKGISLEILEHIKPILDTQQQAKKQPQTHRKFLSSALADYVMAQPEKLKESKNLTKTLALIFCGDEESDFVDAATQFITIYEKGKNKIAIPKYHALANLSKHFRHPT